MMTLENIAPCAQCKGLDVIGTGDCLQPDWLNEIRFKMLETGTGLLMLRPELERECAAHLSRRLRRPLRFLLSTEVCCAPSERRSRGRHHHLIFFPSIESVLLFRSRIQRYGSLTPGRPTFRLSSRELLDLVSDQQDGSALAPAHVLNPWNSALGSMDGGTTLIDIFGDAAERIMAVEMGLTSTPGMCRRLSGLDHHALFFNSDAHSLTSIGREYTLLNVEPSYKAITTGLHTPAAPPHRRYTKFPSERTGYYFNYCHPCDRAFGERTCPRCGVAPAIGTRDRVESIADRTSATELSSSAACQTIYPLAFVIADMMGQDVKNKRVTSAERQLLNALGTERYILTEASESEIAAVTVSELARLIVQQRTCRQRPGNFRSQLSLDL